MNFIKILSIQFKKLIMHYYFNYDTAVQDGRGDIIKKARVSIIKNCIALTKVFTRSPFDTVLLRQTKSMELFNKYDDEQALQDCVDALANEKQEIFSFKLIKPSLVFFNRDGSSLSIISVLFFLFSSIRKSRSCFDLLLFRSILQLSSSFDSIQFDLK
jgi:hypothetical protein